MAEKKSIQCLEGNLSERGLILPTDYVVMKKRFKKELLQSYIFTLGKGKKILDLNPGFDGFYDMLKQSGFKYTCLEQNPRIRSILESRNISVKDWKIPKIPLDDNSVDYVLSTPFIEHLPTYIDALNFLLEVKRVLKTDGKILIIVPNYLNLKAIFYEDYKHGWIATKKRMIDMLSDCHYEVLGSRYTIGWITMRMNPLTACLRLAIYLVMCILRINVVARVLEIFKLDAISSKFKKTFFELIIVEAQIKKAPGQYYKIIRHKESPKRGAYNMSTHKNINSHSEQQTKVKPSHTCGRFQLTGKIHSWTTFCEGIPNIEEGFRYYDLLYRRNYTHLLPQDKNAEVLVTSAGVGYFVTFLNQMGFEKVIGVDSDQSKVEYARAKNFNVIRENAFDLLEDTDNMFDLIVAEQEINHLTKEELVVFLTRARKRLRDGGRLILNSTNYANPLTAIDHFAHNFNHFVGYTENSIEQVFEYCGFGDVVCYPIDNYVFYKDPLNWIAKAITELFSLFFTITYKMYGKSGKLFTKRIIGVGKAVKEPVESDL